MCLGDTFFEEREQQKRKYQSQGRLIIFEGVGREGKELEPFFTWGLIEASPYASTASLHNFRLTPLGKTFIRYNSRHQIFTILNMRRLKALYQYFRSQGVWGYVVAVEPNYQAVHGEMDNT